MVATLFFEILLVVFNDIPAINTYPPGELWLANSYLLLHLIIGATALSGILLNSVALKKEWHKKLNNDYLSLVLNVIVLVCLSIITGLDQIKTGQISVFVINLLVCGVLVITPPLFSFFLYSIPFGVFVTGLFLYQPDITTRNSHIINGGIFLVAVLLISKFIYDNHVSHVVKNIKLEEANQKLLILSLHDPLTNLSNRRNFESHIEHELALIKRFSQNSWLILVDIDHFKDINDRFGHAIGDRVLKDVADLLQGNIRDVDLACRWGGEEFLLLITRIGSDEVLSVARRLCNDLERTSFNIDGQVVSVTASFGIAMLTQHGLEDNDFLTCYKQADQALYYAKLNGRNQVVMAD
ncbi:MAG: GGDEF domain-containing protein [Anaerolineae bacterium]|nr:GGDEF domain-containing protein [Anaerolineae bacterium]